MSRPRSVNYKDYAQYLLSSQINFTQTYFGEHSERIGHDAVNRYMRDERLTPRLLWESVKDEIQPHEDGCIVFDDTVVDKNHSHKIELTYRQYSGNAKKPINGIGVVTCIYVNKDTEEWWPIDYRIYDPDGDGKDKHMHAEEMFKAVLFTKKLPFKYVLMDTWYATTNFMTCIHNQQKIFYCPLKTNRLVKTGFRYERVDSLQWMQEDLEHGWFVRLRGMNAKINTQLYRIAVLTNRFDTIITNDVTQDDAGAVKTLVGLRWKIEQLHRELKQTTGIERCQCRNQRAQRNHIACSFLVLICLRRLSSALKSNVYALKRSLLDNYMRRELNQPSLVFS